MPPIVRPSADPPAPPPSSAVLPGWSRLPRGRLPNGADPRAYYAAEPESARDAFADAWPARCDAIALASLRARCATGEPDRLVAAARERERIAEETRVAEQVRRIHAQQRDDGDGDVLDRARRYLAAVPGGVSGQGRGNDAWRCVLHMVRGWALPGAVALEMLMADYAPRCSPPLPEAEVRGMVRRAERAARAGWGWLREER